MRAADLQVGARIVIQDGWAQREAVVLEVGTKWRWTRNGLRELTKPHPGLVAVAILPVFIGLPMPDSDGAQIKAIVRALFSCAQFGLAVVSLLARTSTAVGVNHTEEVHYVTADVSKAP